MKKFALPLVALGAIAAVVITASTGVKATSCVDGSYTGFVDAKIGYQSQPDYEASAALAFDANCTPEVAINSLAVTNGVISVDVDNPEWRIVKTAKDTWKATLVTTGSHAQVIVGGDGVNMRSGSTITFKVTSANNFWFKASGIAASGQAFEVQSSGAGFPSN